MKLKNIIKIGSFIVAGTLPTTSQGQVYMCQACPAGTYSDGNSTSCTACSGNTYSAVAAGSCTSCPSGQFANSSKTGCINVRNATKLVSQVAKATIATCTTATLDPYQPYRVILRGGKGGNSRSGRKGANGGFVEYNFYVETKQTVELCAGNNGNRKAYNTDNNENPYGYPSNGAGGGAGSWIKFADNTFIAVGGGGGASYNEGSGGGGGGIGAGASGGDGTGKHGGGHGGSVGNYAGGEFSYYRFGTGKGGKGYLKNGGDGTCNSFNVTCNFWDDNDDWEESNSVTFTGGTGGSGGGGGGNGGDRCGNDQRYFNTCVGGVDVDSEKEIMASCKKANPTPGRNYITVKVVTNSDGKISGVSKSISIGGNGAGTNQNDATAGTSTTPTNVGLSGKCSDTGWGCAEIWKVSSY